MKPIYYLHLCWFFAGCVCGVEVGELAHSYTSRRVRLPATAAVPGPVTDAVLVVGTNRLHLKLYRERDTNGRPVAGWQEDAK